MLLEQFDKLELKEGEWYDVKALDWSVPFRVQLAWKGNTDIFLRDNGLGWRRAARVKMSYKKIESITHVPTQST